jgi:hypothetical protein
MEQVGYCLTHSLQRSLWPKVAPRTQRREASKVKVALKWTIDSTNSALDPHMVPTCTLGISRDSS